MSGLMMLAAAPAALGLAEAPAPPQAEASPPPDVPADVAARIEEPEAAVDKFRRAARHWKDKYDGIKQPAVVMPPPAGTLALTTAALASSEPATAAVVTSEDNTNITMDSADAGSRAKRICCTAKHGEKRPGPGQEPRRLH